MKLLQSEKGARMKANDSFAGARTNYTNRSICRQGAQDRFTPVDDLAKLEHLLVPETSVEVKDCEGGSEFSSASLVSANATSIVAIVVSFDPRREGFPSFVLSETRADERRKLLRVMFLE